MLRRLAALSLALPLVTASTGCSKGGLIAAGAVTTVVGMGVAATPGDTHTHEGWFGGTYEHESHGNEVFGGLLVVTGIVLMIAGLAARDDSEKQTVTLYPAPVVPPPMAYVPGYATEAPQVVVDAPSAQTVVVANTAVVEQTTPAAVALSSRVSNRLAIQASALAREGQCEAAVITARKLAEVDFDLYERLLVADPALASCAVR